MEKNMKIYLIKHKFTEEGDFGEAYEMEENIGAFSKREDAEAYIEKFSDETVIKKSYAYDGYEHLLDIEEIEVDVLDINHSPFKYKESFKFVSNGDGTCSVFVEEKHVKEIVIPEKSPAGDTVTSIGKCAFEDCASLTSIIIPDTVTSIGDSAFCECAAMISIIIPDSVTNIGKYAFEGCVSLTSIIIPDTVMSIGEHAFDKCKKLIQKENGVSYVGKWAINYNDGQLTDVELRDGTVGIIDCAFSYCDRLL